MIITIYYMYYGLHSTKYRNAFYIIIMLYIILITIIYCCCYQCTADSAICATRYTTVLYINIGVIELLFIFIILQQSAKNMLNFLWIARPLQVIDYYNIIFYFILRTNKVLYRQVSYFDNNVTAKNAFRICFKLL